MDRAPQVEMSSLADGMVITASVRARLLGLKILRLEADVTVSPVPPRVRIERPVRARQRGEIDLGEAGREGAAASASPGRSNGALGDGLDEAARALEAGAVELQEARRRMP